MLVYNYHPTTHEYIGLNEADEDPLDKGKWLIPANATTITPPEPSEGKFRAFIDGVWSFVDIPLNQIEATDVEPIAIQETIEQIRQKEIISLLEDIDIKSIRPLRAISSGTQTAMDTEKLAFLDDQARLLREELAFLSGATV